MRPFVPSCCFCFSRFTLLPLALLLAVGSGRQACSQLPVDFARDVFPILQRSCFECHGQQKQEGGLRLDQRQATLDSGTIEVGHADDSELIRRIGLPRGSDEIMPAVGEPLSQAQIDVLRRWVDAGAQWPEAMIRREHWAYVPPLKAALPEVENPNWPRNPIDYFVLQRLEEMEMRPAVPERADKLVRRVFLDLIGLPPTPAEVESFTSSPTYQRYEELVDDLLHRPQFGERWARPWLDLARYADSHGFQRDDLRANWAYRDWVIRALNSDMPFDQFTIEQLAGDLLPSSSEMQKVATGFHRCAATNVEAGSLPEETRIEQVLDRVNTTGAVWLGTTLECCQCHDHKYDPFSMREYYQLFAFYNNTELEADLTNPSTPSSIQFQGPTMALSDSSRDTERADLEKDLQVLRRLHNDRRAALEGDLEEWAATFLVQAEDRAETHPLKLLEFQSQGTTDSHEVLDDGSVLLVGGDPPDKDVYTVRARTELRNVRAFLLEALEHPSLPGMGPGRGDGNRANFVLNDFSVGLHTLGLSPDATNGENSEVTKLEFSSATSSFSQNNWSVEGAIDASAKTGWAIGPKFDSSHSATFILKRPIDLKSDKELRFTLVQSFGNARTIGCFRISALTGDPTAESVDGQLLELAAKPSTEWSAVERAKLLDYRTKQDAETLKLAADIGKLERKVGDLAPDTTLVMVELAQPRETRLFERGDYKSPGDLVTADTPAVLHAMPAGPANRLTLANWLVAPENPLVARVTVNRWWAEIFGQGIVATVEDFGLRGEPPTHPELLDWLAVDFVENGWSIKQLLKTIVMSATYQQSSIITPQSLAVDDQNRWLARGPRLRMDAEMIRDNALAIGGLLDVTPFGPAIYPYQPDGIWTKVGGQNYEYKVSAGSQQYRRGIYVVLKRGAPYPSFINFDANARLACTVKRSRTNTPLQALTLLNDPVYVEAARALAERVLIEKSSSSRAAQIDYAFELCVARKPTRQEREILEQLYDQQLAVASTKAGRDKDGTPVEEAWFSLATTLLNLHETITKD